jgi:hypothetical protein
MPKLFSFLLALAAPSVAAQMTEIESKRGLQYGGPCYICGSSDKSVGSPNTQLNFNDIWGDPVSTTCGTLESEASSSYPDLWLQHNLCQAYIYQATQHCSCPGASDNYISNDGCDICGSSMSVPSYKQEAMVNAGVLGPVSCGFLVEQSLAGFIPNSLCPEIAADVQSYCCESNGSKGSTTTPASTDDLSGGDSSGAIQTRSIDHVIWLLAGFGMTAALFY